MFPFSLGKITNFSKVMKSVVAKVSGFPPPPLEETRIKCRGLAASWLCWQNLVAEIHLDLCGWSRIGSLPFPSGSPSGHSLSSRVWSVVFSISVTLDIHEPITMKFESYPPPFGFVRRSDKNTDVQDKEERKKKSLSKGGYDSNIMGIDFVVQSATLFVKLCICVWLINDCECGHP